MFQTPEDVFKWYYETQGDALLKLAGVAGFTRCVPVPADTFAPNPFPLGVMNVWFPNEAEPLLYFVKFVVYADDEAQRLVTEEVQQIHAALGRVPEVLVIALRPNEEKGK